jgi:hypothetical protein
MQPSSKYPLTGMSILHVSQNISQLTFSILKTIRLISKTTFQYLTKYYHMCLNGSIHASLQFTNTIVPMYLAHTCIKCKAMTALNIEGSLATGEYIKAWCHLKGRYRSADDRAPKPCPEMLAKQSNERIQLYTAVPPPGCVMHLNIDSLDVSDAAPTDSEFGMVVGQLCNGCASGAMGMKAKHLKEWLMDMKRKEAKDRVEGLGDH